MRKVYDLYNEGEALIRECAFIMHLITTLENSLWFILIIKERGINKGVCVYDALNDHT